MIPANYNLKLHRGDTGRWQLKLWTDNDKSRPADLAGVTVIATLRNGDRHRNGELDVVHLGCTVIEPNIIEMTLAPNQSRDLSTEGVWDLQLTYPSGDVATVLRGSFSMAASIDPLRKLAAVK